MDRKTRSDCLFDIASSQLGHFTTAQAKDCGYSASLISYHVETGTFYRIYRGVYRLTNYPTSQFEHVIAASLAVGHDKAVASHESALELLDLSDVVPRAIHFTVPRTSRNLPRLRDVRIHTTVRSLSASDVTVRHGIRTTSVTRTIADAATAGTAPEQVELAVRQALDQGLTSRDQLEEAVQRRSERVADLVLGATDEALQ